MLRVVKCSPNRAILKISDLLTNPTVKLLLFLYEKHEARYSEMLRMINSRSTLTLAIKELESDSLITRRIVSETKPAQAYYSLSEKGLKVAESLLRARMQIE
jgi:DNA-binding HxlR family transcriptional regulator